MMCHRPLVRVYWQKNFEPRVGKMFSLWNGVYQQFFFKSVPQPPSMEEPQWLTTGQKWPIKAQKWRWLINSRYPTQSFQTTFFCYFKFEFELRELETWLICAKYAHCIFPPPLALHCDVAGCLLTGITHLLRHPKPSYEILRSQVHDVVKKAGVEIRGCR